MSAVYWLSIGATLLLTAAIGAGTYRTAQLLRVWRPDRNLLLHPVENAVRLGLIVLCVGLGQATGVGPQRLGWSAAQWPRHILMGTLWGILIALFFYFATRALLARVDATSETGKRLYSPALLELIVPNSKREWFLVALAMVPVVLLEELLFRSLLLGALSPVVPAALLLLMTGVIFGLMHSPQGIWGMTGAALAGLLFGILFLQTNSLLLPLAAHYVANMVQITIAMRVQPYYTSTPPTNYP